MSSGSPPVRRRLTAEARRAAILDSARAVFSARGYHSRLDRRHRRRGRGVEGTIYEHFASKQELYANLLESHAAELSDRLAAAVAGVEGSEPRLETGLDAFFRFVEERRDAWRILFREAADPEVVAVLDRVVAEVTALVAAMIAAEPGARTLVRRRGASATRASACWPRCWWAPSSRWRTGGPTTARSRASASCESAMEFTWLGFHRLSRGAHSPGA